MTFSNPVTPPCIQRTPPFPPQAIISNNYFIYRYRTPMIVLISTVVIGIFIYLARRLFSPVHTSRPDASTPPPPEAQKKTIISQIPTHEVKSFHKPKHLSQMMKRVVVKWPLFYTTRTLLCKELATTLFGKNKVDLAVKRHKTKQQKLERTTFLLSIETHNGIKILQERFTKNCQVRTVVNHLIFDDKGPFWGYCPHQIELVHGEKIISHNSQLPKEVTLQGDSLTIRLRE